MKEIEYPKPRELGRITTAEILFGAPIAPIARLSTFSPDDYEDFIREWVEGFLIASSKYIRCTKSSGSGDMGRDVIAYINADGDYDNFQCKHYAHPLMPTDIYLELGKLLYYTFKEEYKCPKTYYFVAPQGCGPTLNRLFEEPEELKKALKGNWGTYCQEKIINGSTIKLEGSFEQYFENFDFKIIQNTDPQTVIDQHTQTIYFPFRFGGGIRKKREKVSTPPHDIATTESIYTSELFKSYSEYKNSTINSQEDIQHDSELLHHFNRQRLGFYSADSLNQFSRDTFPSGTDYFAELKNEFYDGVVDICTEKYSNGYLRVKATTNHAKVIVIADGNNPLATFLSQSDREGLCNHLVNDKRFKWANNG